VAPMKTVCLLTIVCCLVCGGPQRPIPCPARYLIHDGQQTRVLDHLTRASSPMRAFAHDGEGMHDLYDLIVTDDDWEPTSARAISNRGQITGYGVPNGEERAFVLRSNPFCAHEAYTPGRMHISARVGH